MKIFKITLLFFCILILSCEREIETEGLTGTLAGKVSLISESRQYIEDQSGVEITLEGSGRKTFTDTDGKFIFENLKSGTYNLVYQKEGFCTQKTNSFSFVGGNKPIAMGEKGLFEVPNTEIDSISITRQHFLSERQLEIWCSLYHPVVEGGLHFRYFVSNSSDVSYKNYIFSEDKGGYSTGKTEFLFDIDSSDFPSNSELYIVVYPSVYNTTSQYYIDINTGQKIYTCINIESPSKVAKMTVPEFTDKWWMNNWH